MKTRIAIVVAILLVAAGAYALFSRKGDTTTGNYRFVTIEKGDLESVVSATGTLSAVKTVQVGTQISGLISKMLVDFNDRVEAGQVIAQLDTTLLETAILDAEATRERNQAQLRQAQRDFDRLVVLHQQGIVADTDFNTAQYNLDIARASVKSSDAAAARARQNLSYATITAPVSGIVVERDVDVGQTVASSLSAPKLFLIANDLSEMQILASVDESDIGQIKQGQAVRFTVKAYQDRKFTGTVKQVRLQSTTEQNIVNYTVVIAVANPDGTLLPGMTATVEFLVATATDVFKISNAALRFRPSEAIATQVRERLQKERAAAAARAEGQTTGPGAPAGPGSSGNPGALGGDSGSLAGTHAAPGTGRPTGSAGEFPGAGAGRDRGFPAGPAIQAGQEFPGGARPAGNGRGTGASRPRNFTMLYFLDDQGAITAMPVRAGITDGQFTEIRGRKVEAGMHIITGMTAAAQSNGSTNPFQSSTQSGPGGPPRGGF